MSSFSSNEASDQGGIPEFVCARLRAQRERIGMSVRALARVVGVSPSFISQIENGKANPSVGRLLAIASALELSLDELFDGSEAGEPQAPPGGEANAASAAAPQDGAPPARVAISPTGPAHGMVLRKADRRRIELAGGVRWERLTADVDPVVTFLYVRYEVGGASCPADSFMQHSGREYGVVLSGRLGAQIGDMTYELDPGDSIVTDCMIPHRFWTVGDEPAIAVWAVVVQPAD